MLATGYTLAKDSLANRAVPMAPCWLIWCSTIALALLKEKQSVLLEVVIGNLRPPSGLQWTRNELKQQFGLWLTLIVTSHWEYSVYYWRCKCKKCHCNDDLSVQQICAECCKYIHVYCFKKKIAHFIFQWDCLPSSSLSKKRKKIKFKALLDW